jgi:hypothetical protein
MAKIDYQSLMNSLNANGLPESLLAQTYRGKFDLAKKNLIRDFLAHPVTQEILAGPTASNISGTLNGRGNLFSFIGFPEGSKPINDVLSAIEQGLTLRPFTKKVGIRNIAISYSIKIPLEEIEDASPLPFEPGLSWVTGIEEGISGFGSYVSLIKKAGSSRSGYGIQSDSAKLPGEFHTRPYMSVLFNSLLEALE